MNKLSERLNILPLIVRKILAPILWIIGILVSLYVLYVVIITIMYAIWVYQDYKYSKFRKTQPFNSTLWKKAFIGPDGKEDHYLEDAFDRCYMYKDLVKNHLRLHMTYEAVIKLLGDSYPYGDVSYYVNPELKSIDYFLGRCELGDRLLCFTPEYERAVSIVHFYFDKNQKLVAVKMHSDNGYKKYPMRDKNISIKDIENKYPGGWGNKDFLFECNTKLNYYGTFECKRYVEETYNYGPSKGKISYNAEYCNVDEIKNKWGYEMW
jgi:hypothetical protein